MNNDKKPSAPDLGEGLPVKELRFSRPNGIETPINQDHVSKIITGKQWDSDVVVTFYPRIRHHQVVVTRGEGEAFTRRVFMVHESWCTWLVP